MLPTSPGSPPGAPHGFGQAPNALAHPPNALGPPNNGGVPAPAAFGQAPAAFGQAPAAFGQAPAGYSPAPAGYSPAPAAFGQAPAGYSPAPAGYSPVPAGFNPARPGFTALPFGGPAPAPQGFGAPASPGFGPAPPFGGPAPAAFGAPPPGWGAPVAASAGASGPPRAWGERARMAVGWMTLFLIGTDLFVISPLLPVVAERYQIDVTTAGWTLTSFSFAYMLAAPFLGGLSDRHGRRRVMAAGLVAFGVANFLTSVISGVTDSFAALVLTRAAAGFSAAAITPSVYAATGDMAPPARRASWLAVVGSGLLIALALGAPLGGLIAAVLGIRSVFTAIALACFALALLNARAWPGGLPPAPPAPPAAMAQAAGPPRPLTALLLVGAVGPTVLWSASLFGAYTYLAGGLAAAAGATTADTALVIVFFGAGMVAGNLSGGRAADRFGPESVMSAAYLGLGLCWLVVAQFAFGGPPDGRGLPAIGVGFALASFVAQLFFPAQQARLARTFAARRAAALAWNNSALYLGMSLGAAIGGAVFRRAGFPALLNALAVLAFLSALLLSSLTWASQARAARLAEAAR